MSLCNKKKVAVLCHFYLSCNLGQPYCYLRIEFANARSYPFFCHAERVLKEVGTLEKVKSKSTCKCNFILKIVKIN